MGITVKLPNDLVNAAKAAAQAMSRSTPKQIEYWAKIGKAAEQNPDLPIGFIADLLKEVEQVKSMGVNSDNFSDFEFDEH